MQNVDPYKRESIAQSFISVPALAALVCMVCFWQSITPFDAVKRNSSDSKSVDLRDAPDIIERAEAMKPLVLVRQGNMAKAIDEANLLIKKHGNTDAIAVICAGDTFIAAGLPDDGLKYLKRGLGLAQRNKFAVRHYAQKLTQVGRRDDAIAQYKSLAKLYPGWDVVHLELAQLYMAANLNAEAAEELKAVCDIDGRNFAARKLRGIALAKSQQLKPGLDEYVIATAQENQGGIPDILRPILGEKGNGAIQGAIQRGIFELEKQVEGRPDDYLPKLRLAQLYAYSGDSKKAKELLVEARRTQPNNPELHRTLAVVLKQLGEDNPAMSSFALSVKLEEQQQRQKDQPIRTTTPQPEN